LPFAPDCEQASVGLAEDLVAEALYDFWADEWVEWGLIWVRYLLALVKGILLRLKSALTISRADLLMSRPRSLQMLSSAI